MQISVSLWVKRAYYALETLAVRRAPCSCFWNCDEAIFVWNLFMVYLCMMYRIHLNDLRQKKSWRQAINSRSYWHPNRTLQFAAVCTQYTIAVELECRWRILEGQFSWNSIKWNTLLRMQPIVVDGVSKMNRAPSKNQFVNTCIVQLRVTRQCPYRLDAAIVISLHFHLVILHSSRVCNRMSLLYVIENNNNNKL